MYRRVFVLVLSLWIGMLFTPLAAQQKILQLRKTDQPIVIDGMIDAIWQVADSVDDFVQFRPYYGQAPTRRTCAKVLTTDEALYCLMICYDHRKNIQANTGKLDDFGGDIVSIMLDTFGDRRTAYKFAVSAAGVRSDCRMLDDGRNRDYSWDGVWFSAAKIYDWGFIVEMKIPYRSIQYDENLSEWGLDFDRWIPASTEDIYWCHYAENEGLRISKFARLLFSDFRPQMQSLHLEIYPVGISKVQWEGDRHYHLSPNAGIDLFYNPSPKLTFQFTANPDFAQIEADPFEFNISRYESYFDERRPFFTEGREVFTPSGREHDSGFYRPLELFYSRRIGKKLPDGSEVPLLLGAKAFGRIGMWEYGGFIAMTDQHDYLVNGEKQFEPQAYFSSIRIKKQILKNSSVGLLYVGKTSKELSTGVVDIDGALRGSDWQLSYQLARSYKNNQGDFAASFGLMMPKEKYFLAARGQFIGKQFDVQHVGFVPWQGTGEFVALGGPRWFSAKGAIHSIMIYTGAAANYERLDEYTDRIGIIGLNMQFRSNWGYEINYTGGRSKDQSVFYDSKELHLSSWMNISPKWHSHLFGGYSKTYNFSRNYLAFFAWMGNQFNWRPVNILNIGYSFKVYVEGNPQNQIEDITYNARPFVSITPINNLNLRFYWDNVYVRSSARIERMIAGFLFSYNFRPKSWIYLAINEVQDRSEEYDTEGRLLPTRLHIADRVSVLKLKYLFYF